MVVVDFSTFNGWASKKITCFFCVLLYKDQPISKEDNGKKYYYFNFLCDHTSQSHDIFFVIQAFKILFRDPLLNRFKKVHIWSDGCATHFKQKRMQFYMSKAKEEFDKEFDWNFFISLHAHNMCDTQARTFKRIGEHFQVKNNEFIDGALVLKEIVDKKLPSNNKTIVLSEILRFDFDCDGFPDGVQRFHYFKYLGEGEIQTSVLSSDIEITEKSKKEQTSFIQKLNLITLDEDLLEDYGESTIDKSKPKYNAKNIKQLEDLTLELPIIEVLIEGVVNPAVIQIIDDENTDLNLPNNDSFQLNPPDFHEFDYEFNPEDQEMLNKLVQDQIQNIQNALNKPDSINNDIPTVNLFPGFNE